MFGNSSVAGPGGVRRGASIEAAAARCQSVIARKRTAEDDAE
jgi:hypothetical protein